MGWEHAPWPKGCHGLAGAANLTTPAADAAAPAKGNEPVRIIRRGAEARQGPAQNFVGKVTVDTPFRGTDGARVGGATVTFAPGSRTAWHTHPLGQTLVVTAGRGWVQREGGLVEEIGPGDVAWIGPDVRHWHGATPTEGMTHIAISENQDGTTVSWMEQVSDAEYRR